MSLITAPAGRGDDPGARRSETRVRRIRSALRPPVRLDARHARRAPPDPGSGSNRRGRAGHSHRRHRSPRCGAVDTAPLRLDPRFHTRPRNRARPAGLGAGCGDRPLGRGSRRARRRLRVPDPGRRRRSARGRRAQPRRRRRARRARGTARSARPRPSCSPGPARTLVERRRTDHSPGRLAAPRPVRALLAGGRPARVRAPRDQGDVPRRPARCTAGSGCRRPSTI